MRRWILYCALALGLALLGELPFRQNDVGKLLPVETSLLYIEDGQVVVETDMGLRGQGATLSAAVKDLEQRAPGVVFYDTGNYILLHESAMPLLLQLPQAEYLRGSCTVCRVAERELDLAEAGKYLAAHEPEVDLRRVEAAQAAGEELELPELQWSKGAFFLVSGEE